jgi:hypothetical protein
MPPSSRCCRSCPRCNDCPVLVAAATRARRREDQPVSADALVDQVFAGASLTARALPESVTRTLAALDAARRGTRPLLAGAEPLASAGPAAASASSVAA